MVVAAVSAAMSWWYSRSLAAPAARVTLTTTEVRQELASLLRLGLRVHGERLPDAGRGVCGPRHPGRFEGVEAAGLFQAAWTVGGLYVGFVLQAMGADFYPRLVAAADDDASCNRLVNEQAQVSVLLGRSRRHRHAHLGAMGRFSALQRRVRRGDGRAALGLPQAWPARNHLALGYIPTAKGSADVFVVVDLARAVANVGLSLFPRVRLFGLEGAGTAFFASPTRSTVLILFSRLRANDRLPVVRGAPLPGLVFVSVIGIVHVTFHELGGLAAMAVGSMATLWSAGYSLHTLRRLVPAQDVPKRFAWLMKLDKEGT